MLVSLLTGCASTRAYLGDRGRDAADIFTLAGGCGAGAKVRIGPVHVGLAAIHDMAGVRGGELFVGHIDRHIEPIDLETTWFYDEDYGFGHKRFKDYAVNGYHGHPFFATIDDYWFRQDGDHPFLHPFYTQIEVAGGFLGTLRVGFNPGELLDFILGWTTIDVFHDDLGMRRVRQERAEATATER